MYSIPLEEPIGVLGYGVEGRSTCRFLLREGARRVLIFDRRHPGELPPGVHYAGSGKYLQRLGGVRTLFRSAGVRPDLPELESFRGAGGRVTSQVELFFERFDRRRIVGVTGTLGKGTACSLLEAMLKEAGIPCRLGGNIGIPVLDLLPELGGSDTAILELSSFQLSTLAESPALAAVLLTTSEHLDWHLSRREYWEHKSGLTRRQRPEDFLAYCADAEGSRFIASLSPARKEAYGRGRDVDLEDGRVVWRRRGFAVEARDLRLKGAFNLENVAAAGILALELGVDPPRLMRAAAEFPGLEHRLEFVRRAGGLSFYNDSYATRPEAAAGAIEAFARELAETDSGLGIILGGSEKYADFDELAARAAAAPHLRAAALIGETAARLAEALERRGIPRERIRRCPDLEAALDFLLARVDRGVVLLSPACASFGLFKDYKERGRAFKKLVDRL